MQWPCGSLSLVDDARRQLKCVDDAANVHPAPVTDASANHAVNSICMCGEGGEYDQIANGGDGCGTWERSDCVVHNRCSAIGVNIDLELDMKSCAFGWYTQRVVGDGGAGVDEGAAHRYDGDKFVGC